jgi:putative acetyltransferase
VLRISPAQDPEDILVARNLLREYVQSLEISLEQGFSAELAGLPGGYRPPDGVLLIARASGQPIGCVAVRRLNDRVCEMKRLFVRANNRGSGAGRALIQAAVDAARGLGYEELWLDTLATMTEAHRLYRTLGFVEIQPYGHDYAEGSKFFGFRL